jgi:hypothetical protein
VEVGRHLLHHERREPLLLDRKRDLRVPVLEEEHLRHRHEHSRSQLLKR